MSSLPEKNEETTDAGKGMSRRDFVKFAGKGALGIAFLSVTPIGSTRFLTESPDPNDIVQHLRRSTFGGHLGEDFRVVKGAFDGVNLELVEVADAGPKAVASSQETFSIVFRGPNDQPLEQSTYMVEHQAFGTFPLFIVPTYGKSDGAHYEAVFNRMVG